MSLLDDLDQARIENNKAVVISGAAARGAFAAGVLANLKPFGSVYGTSSGALNAAAWAFGGPACVTQQWMGVTSIDDVYEFNGADALWLPGLYNNSPLYKKALGVVSKGPPLIPVTVTVANLASGAAEYWSVGPTRSGTLPAAFAAAVAQSASIPGLCCDMNDWDRVDGGILVNLPMRKAIEDGCTDITLILDQPYQETYQDAYSPLPGGLGLLADVVRAVQMYSWAAVWNEIQDLAPRCKVLTVYAPLPGQLTADYLDFSHDTISATFQLGQVTKAAAIK